MTVLSSGLVSLSRNHANSGVVVHAATEHQFVHLRVVPAFDFDANGVDAVVVPANDNRVSFRVAIGHASKAMLLTFDDVQRETRLVDNIWVAPGEEIWVSTSCPNSFLAYGFTTKKPILSS